MAEFPSLCLVIVVSHLSAIKPFGWLRPLRYWPHPIRSFRELGLAAVSSLIPLTLKLLYSPRLFPPFHPLGVDLEKKKKRRNKSRELFMERRPLHSATPHRLRGRWRPPLYFRLGHFALQTSSTSGGRDRVRGGQTTGFQRSTAQCLQRLLGIDWFGGQFTTWNVGATRRQQEGMLTTFFFNSLERDFGRVQYRPLLTIHSLYRGYTILQWCPNPE